MEQFVKAAIAGRQEAFEQLVIIYKPKLLAKAYSYVKNREDALDIVQETLIKAYKSIHQLKEPRYFTTWLYKILIRESFFTLKQKKRTLIIESELIQQQILEQEQSNANYEFVHEALASLRNEYQTALILFYFYDFKIQEIAHMTERPNNTIKMHLYRGRNELKKKLEIKLKKSIQQKEVVTMLKDQLKEIAFKFVTVPNHYQLFIEDYSNQEASFIWKADNLDEGFEITLNHKGQLISLSKPSSLSGNTITSHEQQLIAEQFLTELHEEALSYLSLSYIKEEEQQSSFYYEQFVGNLPLASYYTKITVSKCGEVLEFSYNGFTNDPPQFPMQLASKEMILKQLYEAKWTCSLRNLSTDCYSVPTSGLYVIYESPIVYQSYYAHNGQATFEQENPEQEEVLIPFPQVNKLTKKTTIEEIIGIPDTMEKVRESLVNPGILGIVWREKAWQAPEDKSFESYLMGRIDQSVKVEINTKTNQFISFTWFKERIGNGNLSFEACCEIACAFIATYFEEYVPYLQLRVDEPSFNDVHRTFFTFPLQLDGLLINGEQFYVGVNRTTGFIDILWSPKIELEAIKIFLTTKIAPFSEIFHALKDIDVHLSWERQYNENENETEEILQYHFGRMDTKQRIIGIDALSGQLIVSTLI